MLIRSLPLLSLALLSPALFAAAAQAGTKLETVNRDLSSKGGATTIHTRAQNGMMRVEAEGDRTARRSTMIFKGDTIYAINHQDKRLMSAATKMAELMREMMSTMDAPWLKQMADRQMQNFAALGGIPVLSRHFEAGTLQSETTLASIRTEALAAATFEIPAGYTRKEMLPAP